MFLLAFVGFLFVAYPRVSIHPGISLNPQEPFQTVFDVRNDGYLSINNVKILLKVKSLKTANGRLTFNDVRFPDIDDFIPELKANRTSSISLRRVISGQLPYSNIEASIILSYRPDFIPFTFTENSDFTLRKNASNEYVWIEKYSTK